MTWGGWQIKDLFLNILKQLHENLRYHGCEALEFRIKSNQLSRMQNDTLAHIEVLNGVQLVKSLDFGDVSIKINIFRHLKLEIALAIPAVDT